MDDLDRGIIRLLRSDGRAGYGDLGTAVGLSASAVKRRIDRLVADGVIRGFTVQLDPGYDGLAIEAHVEVFCRGTVSPETLRRILATIPEVVDASTVTGEADAVVTIRARDMVSLEHALEGLRDAPSIDHTRSAVVLTHLVRRPSD